MSLLYLLFTPFSKSDVCISSRNRNQIREVFTSSLGIFVSIQGNSSEQNIGDEPVPRTVRNQLLSTCEIPSTSSFTYSSFLTGLSLKVQRTCWHWVIYSALIRTGSTNPSTDDILNKLYPTSPLSFLGEREYNTPSLYHVFVPE